MSESLTFVLLVNQVNCICVILFLHILYIFNFEHYNAVKIKTKKERLKMAYDYDIIIIGAGPGGYVAAIRAAQLGKKVALLEKDKPGGVCLNVGCIPSKALIHQAQAFSSIKDLEGMGIKTDLSGFEYEKVFEKSRKIADTLSKGVQFLMKKNKVELIMQQGKIESPNSVRLSDSKIISAENIIIATGSSPRVIKGFEFDEDKVLSSTGVLMMKKLPKSILILGSGAIGVEFAHILSSFGVKVHIVEMLDQILPIEDSEVVQVLHKSFKKRGIEIYTSTKAKSMTKDEDGVTVLIEDKEGKESVIQVEKILVAVGRSPNTGDIGLDKVGIETERGFIPTYDYYQTKIPSIYAIGDVINSPLLAHVASKEGEVAVEHICGHETIKKIDPMLIPGGVYCEPEISSFGYNEQRAIKEGISFKKAVFPYRGAGKSVAIDKPDGMVKIIYNPQTKEILGAHIVGEQATELIHELLLAKTSGIKPSEIATMIHSHPTLSETVMEAARAVEGWAIHA